MYINLFWSFPRRLGRCKIFFQQKPPVLLLGDSFKDFGILWYKVIRQQAVLGMEEISGTFPVNLKYFNALNVQ
jgi:hypothetical protein